MFLFKPLPGVDYRPPKLTRGNPDWVIRYYVKDPAKGRLRRIRIKVNHIKPLKQRARVAREMMAAISERLALGWNPLRDATAPKSSVSAFDAYGAFLKVKSKESEAQSIASYKSYIKIFKAWLCENGFDQTRPIGCVTRETALAFMDHLNESAGISARTWNNYLSFLQTLHAWLERNNPEYLAVCLLCYACFVRPKEIALLRCRDIDLDRQTVFVSRDIAKNDNDSFRTIPDAAISALRKLDLSHPEWALFGKNSGRGDDFSPARQPANQRKFAGYWMNYVRPALGNGVDSGPSLSGLTL